MAACPMKDKKRVTLLYILSVLVLLLSFVGLAYAYQAGSYTDDDFKRQITIDFAGGTADLQWVYMIRINRYILMIYLFIVIMRHRMKEHLQNM